MHFQAPLDTNNNDDNHDILTGTNMTSLSIQAKGSISVTRNEESHLEQPDSLRTKHQELASQRVLDIPLLPSPCLSSTSYPAGQKSAYCKESVELLECGAGSVGLEPEHIIDETREREIVCEQRTEGYGLELDRKEEGKHIRVPVDLEVNRTSWDWSTSAASQSESGIPSSSTTPPKPDNSMNLINFDGHSPVKHCLQMAESGCEVKYLLDESEDEYENQGEEERPSGEVEVPLAGEGSGEDGQTTECSTSTEEEEEEEDPDSHPLYLLLSNSTLPPLRTLWNSSHLILVPPRRSVPSLVSLTLPENDSSSSKGKSTGFEFVRGAKGVGGETVGRDVEKEREMDRDRREALLSYVSLHTFKLDPSVRGGGGGQVWRSPGEGDGFVRVRMEAARGLIHVEWIGQNQAEGTFPSPLASDPIKPASRVNSIPAAMESVPIPFPSLEHRTSRNLEANDSIPTLLSPIGEYTKSNSNSSPFFLPSPPSLSPSPNLPLPTSLIRSLQIVSETTIYRRPYRPTPAAPEPPSPLKNSTNKPAFKVPKWLRRGSSAQSLPSPTTTPTKLEKERTPMLERVRVIALDGEIVLGFNFEGRNYANEGGRGPDKQSSLSGTPSGTGKRVGRKHSTSSASLLMSASGHNSTGHGGLKRSESRTSMKSTRSGMGVWHYAGRAGVGGSRDFVADLAFLVTPPPALASYTILFVSTLVIIRSLVKDYEASFVYVEGFDAYTVQRIRSGILDKAWTQLESRLIEDEQEHGVKMISEERVRLSQLLENVVMGLLHSKLYISYILPLYFHENTAINHILSLYRSRSVLPSELGVDICDFGRGEALRAAISAMAKLSRYGVTIGSVSPELLHVLKEDTSEQLVLKTLVEARTPLGCISAMRLAMSEIVNAVERVKPGSRAAPDDLITILAWVIVQSGANDLESLIYFVKTFRLSDYLAAEMDFSFVTFQASLAFLLSDPLDALASSPLPPSPVIPQSSSLRASDLPSFRPRRSSLQHANYSASDVASGPSTSPQMSRLNHNHRAPAPPRVAITAGRMLGLGVSMNAVSPVRERRLSWSQARKRASMSLETEWSTSLGQSAPKTERSNSSEQMPPPEWNTTTKHQRRQSLGTLPSSLPIQQRYEDSLAESGSHNPRPSSVASTSSLELQIRPRIVLPPNRSFTRSLHDAPWEDASPYLTPPLSGHRRNNSNTSSRQLGPIVPPLMIRTDSENSNPGSFKRSTSDWSLWGTARSPSPADNRPLSPALSETTTGSGHGREPSSLSSGEDSWWGWGRSQGSHSVATTLEEGSSVGRARRHSTSAVEILGARVRSLPIESSLQPSAARLAVVIASHNSGSAPRPRPRSVMSFETDPGLSSHGSTPSTSPRLLSSRKAPGHSSIRRELFPVTRTRTTPLEPLLDSSQILSLPFESKSFARTDSMTSLSRLA